jgi:hypothetical protein
MAGAFTAWFNLSTHQGTFRPTPENCIPGTAGSLPVTATLALSSGCAAEFLEVTSFDDPSDSLAVAEGGNTGVITRIFNSLEVITRCVTFCGCESPGSSQAVDACGACFGWH